MPAKTQYEREIREQPDALRRLLRQGKSCVEHAAAHLHAHPPRYVCIAGRGSSHHAARYGKYLLGAFQSWPVAFAAPSLNTLYAAAPNLACALTIGMSQSGQSPDIVTVVRAARTQGSTTFAITNDPSSPLAQAAEHCIPLFAGEEKAIAATKTYTAELMALAMLSAALSGDQIRWRQLERVPDLIEHTLKLNHELPTTSLKPLDRLMVLGRGFNEATAFELALKVTETSSILAVPYSLAEFQHGPVSLIGEGFPVLLVDSRGKASANVSQAAQTLMARGATLLVISNDENLLAKADVAVALPDAPEWLSPFVATAAGQLLAGALAQARGLHPDRPRGLTKVTRTL